MTEPRYHPVRVPSRDLTQREIEVMSLLAGGLSDRDIARRLGISVHTVRGHIRKIHVRLDVHSRLEAMLAWHRMTGEIADDPPEVTVTVRLGGLTWHGRLSPSTPPY